MPITDQIRRFCIPAIIALAALTLSAGAQTPGKDGSKTVNNSQVLNTYTSLASDALSGTTSISVANNAGISSGDLIMIYQAQGADISTANDATYGSITNYNNAGHYEIVGVASVLGTTVINISMPLWFSYDDSGAVQIVRIPQYSQLHVNPNGVITAPAWNGQTGGIVAIHVQNSTTIRGAIDVSGKGFRGGTVTGNGPSSADYTTYRSTSSTDGAMKGESIAGPASMLPDGAYGRGAPANGGGGGNSYNAGGGGGANGNSGGSWTGQGVMCTSCTGASAWALDSAYIQNSGSYTSSAGGGRGGYTTSISNQNALSTAPGDSAWGGNLRRERGGLGGRPVNSDPCTRILFGGGGGAGSSDNNAGGDGGNGGGIIVLMGSTVSGAGSLLAGGEDGASTVSTHNDAPGGGGGGGTIVVSASLWLTDLTLSAEGGNGGNQLITTNEAEGPGGGGGGGCIITSTTIVSRSVAGGSGGTTSSSSLTEFPANGATGGNTGEIHTASCSGLLPVELTSFTARQRGHGIALEWHTATEINNFGFEVERKLEGNQWQTIGFVDGRGTTNAPQSYAFTDRSAELRTRYGTVEYRLLQIDRDGTSAYSSPITLDLIGMAAEATMSIAPNPLRESGHILLNIAHGGDYSLSVYDYSGRKVTSIVPAQPLETGSYSFALRLDNTPPGPYILVLESDLRTLTYAFTKLY